MERSRDKRSRSRDKRSRSRDKRSRSRDKRSRSRDKRSRSRGRARSRARSKSRARSRSSRSASRSRKKSRAKSRSRKSRSRSSERSHHKDKKKKSPTSNHKSSHSSSGGGGEGGLVTVKEEKGLNVECGAAVSAENSLLEGLKKVINSKELEHKKLKDNIHSAQPVAPLKSALKSVLKPMLKTAPAPAPTPGHPFLPGHPLPSGHPSTHGPAWEGSIFSMFSDNDSLLPHERSGSDFSWIQTQSAEDLVKLKANEVEDEESFLYGNDELSNSAANIANTASAPQYPAPSSSQSYPILNTAEFDKIKNILKSVGSNSEGAKVKHTVPPAVSEPAAFTLPALCNPNVRQALESLQSLIKATKEKRAQEKGDGESSVSSQSSSKKVSAECKQARKTKIEFLIKELEGLIKQDGLGFLTPVIGFYCHKCEEFIGNLSTAEKHAATHRSSGRSSGDKHPGEDKTDLKKDSKKEKQKSSTHATKATSATSVTNATNAANATNAYLKEKLQAERMLITVSCGGEPTNQSAQGKQEKGSKRGRDERSRSRSTRSRSRSRSRSSSEGERLKKPHKKKKKGKKKKDKK
ncbi:hypothetical protein NQD34_011051 [Periophthalmus magnuspinnatus]|nr:hypothetical protein NQD34_011051 [Periophthalmus magnuspinnatus]